MGWLFVCSFGRSASWSVSYLIQCCIMPSNALRHFVAWLGSAWLGNEHGRKRAGREEEEEARPDADGECLRFVSLEDGLARLDRRPDPGGATLLPCMQQTAECVAGCMLVRLGPVWICRGGMIVPCVAKFDSIIGSSIWWCMYSYNNNIIESIRYIISLAGALGCTAWHRYDMIWICVPLSVCLYLFIRPFSEM